MKNIYTLILAVLLSGAMYAQVDVELRINHKLATQNFQLNNTAQNSLGNDFQVTRLQYYLTRISVDHDGGMTTTISDDTLALIDASSDIYTTIKLGNHNITTVEGVNFYVGVYAPVNNADPSLQPMGHPLAPQSPSMHWGWAAGYRFVAFEGVAGSGFSEIFQFHGLGNTNYYETSVTAVGQMVLGNLIISIDADYTEAIRGIDVSGGIISHGETGEAQDVLANFNQYVFSAASEPVTVDEQASIGKWSVYPNPSAGITQIRLEGATENVTYEIRNTLGQLVETGTLINGVAETNIDVKGQYFVQLISDSQSVETKKLIIQ